MTAKEARKLLGKPAQELDDDQINDLILILRVLAKERLGIKV